MLDPIVKLYAVRAPDTPGPCRTGHGVIVFTSAPTPDDALIQAPLSVDIRIRDAFDWSHAVAYDVHPVGVHLMKNRTVRFTFDVPPVRDNP